MQATYTQCSVFGTVIVKDCVPENGIDSAQLAEQDAASVELHVTITGSLVNTDDAEMLISTLGAGGGVGGGGGGNAGKATSLRTHASREQFFPLAVPVQALTAEV